MSVLYEEYSTGLIIYGHAAAPSFSLFSTLSLAEKQKKLQEVIV
jgi:hypothetical protein